MKRLFAALLAVTLAAGSAPADQQLFPGFTMAPYASMGVADQGGANGTQTNTINAAGEELNFAGYLWKQSGSGTCAITSIQFFTGSVISAGGTETVVSIEGVNLTTGAPYRPDGTVANSATAELSTLTATAWNSITIASTSKTHNDLMSVRFKLTNFAGADTFSIQAMRTPANVGNFGYAFSADSGSTWTASGVAGLSTFVFGCSGGGVAFLGPAPFPFSGENQQNFTTATTPDEVAVRWNMPFPSTIVGVRFFGLVNSNADFDIVVYDSGGSALKTKSVDASAIVASANFREWVVMFDSGQALTAGQDYYITIKPTTTTANVTVQYYDVNANDHLAAHYGVNNYWFTRTDAGAWSGTNTRVPAIQPLFAMFDDATGAGGIPVHIYP